MNYMLDSKVLVLSALLVLVGCSRSVSWTKVGFDTQLWQVDDAACHDAALQQYPPVFHNYQLPGYKEPVKTRCTGYGKSIECKTSGGESSPISVTEDLNKGNRAQSWERCIKSRGYFTVQEQKNILKQANPVIEAMQLADSEQTDLCNKEKYAILFDKIGCKSDLTLLQLSDNSKLPTRQKSLLSALREEEKAITLKVKEALIQSGMQKAIAGAHVLERTTNLMDQNYLMLLEGKLSFGDFNKRQKALSEEFNESFKQAVQ